MFLFAILKIVIYILLDMTKWNYLQEKKKTAKEKEYENIKNKYRNRNTEANETVAKSANLQPNHGSEEPVPDRSATLSPNMALGHSPAPSPLPSPTLSNKSENKSRSFSAGSSIKKASSKIKSSLKVTKSEPSTSAAGSALDSVRQGLSERGEKLQQTVERTEELRNRTKDFRSVSRRLKDKQAEKLKKSKLPW